MQTESEIRPFSERLGDAARDDFVRLADDASDARRFFADLLPRLTELLGGRAAGVWIGEGGNLGLLADYQLAQVQIGQDVRVTRGAEACVRSALGKTLPSNRTLTLPGGEPLDLLLIPFSPDRSLPGVLKIAGPAGSLTLADDSDRSAAEEIGTLIERFFDRAAEAARSTDPSWVTAQFAPFCEQLHATLNAKTVCRVAVDEGRHLLNCDRLMIVRRRGGRWRVSAVSGQGTISRRSPLVKQVEKLAQVIGRRTEPLRYRGNLDDFPKQPGRLLAQYVDAHDVRLLDLIPLIPEEPKGDGPKRRRRKPRAILMCENFRSNAPSTEYEHWGAECTGQIATALTNAERFERLRRIAPLESLGAAVESLCSRRIAIVALVISLVLGAGKVASLVPVPDRVRCSGNLWPTVRRSVFAPAEGEVVALHVGEGARVTPGMPLIQLESDLLKTREVKLKGTISEKELLAHALEISATSDTNLDQQRRIELKSDLAALHVELIGLRQQLELVQESQAELSIVAPIRGVIVERDLSRRLLGKPVGIGETFLTVADDQGDWKVEADLPERRWRKFDDANSRGDVTIRYRFADGSGEWAEAQFVSYATGAERADLGQVIKIDAELELKDQKLPPIGSAVEVEIDCGQVDLLSFLFEDAIAFARRTLWL
ncbi:HlyD family efflux transporter periplasmic adaptor subunit [Stratiformator vulcanicus]|uniref:HlyD family secretion protein n=1 Tax=Stratiformator vulcanicus TaxID=2527980 RepID=A0A517QX83_9PLAN|nr:HlyD family secretion protein [Stratiformator vulcanicus]QDT36188.1 hypothetical protein Pan189_05430 [Stratiformator vulcanicus]